MTLKEEEIGEDLLDSLMFRELMDTKVEVRAPCRRCDGDGERRGEECDVCRGEKILVQPMTLYALAKKIVPLLLREMRKAAANDGA